MVEQQVPQLRTLVWLTDLQAEARQVALLQLVVDQEAYANRQRNQADWGTSQHIVLIQDEPEG